MRRGDLTQSAHNALKYYLKQIPNLQEVVVSEDPKELKKVLDEIFLYISERIREERLKMFNAFKNVQHLVKVIDTLESDDYKKAFKQVGILTDYRACIQCKKYLPDNCFEPKKLACWFCRWGNEMKRKNGKKVPIRKVAPLKAKKALEHFLGEVKGGLYFKGDYQIQGAIYPKRGGVEVTARGILKVHLANSVLEFNLGDFTVDYIANLLWEKGIAVI